MSKVECRVSNVLFIRHSPLYPRHFLGNDTHYLTFIQMKLSIGDTYEYEFRFSQEEVIAFAQLTGDDNPLHLDPDYAATTPFKRPIIHGMLGASVFTKIIGTRFPGYGSIYVGQTFQFLRPMFVDTDYKVKFTVQSLNPEKHTGEILGEVFDVTTGKITTKGVATLMHKEKI